MIHPALALLVFLLPQQEPSEKERRGNVEKNVDKAVEKGLRALKSLQQPSGQFEWSGMVPHGATSLALYTLLASGESLEDPAVAKALNWMLSNPVSMKGNGSYDTYQISLTAVALSYAIPRMRAGASRNEAGDLLQRAADWLVDAQDKRGGWGYQSNGDWHDHSNSQFAILGLRAATNAGAKVKRDVWAREVQHYKYGQFKDGGWGYHACHMGKSSVSSPTTSMTAAGVMALAIALGSAGAPEKIPADPSIKAGLAALRALWQRGLTVKMKDLGGITYVLYSIERACMLTGTRLLGNIDWYVDGAWILLNEQTSDGSWGTGDRSVAPTCFSLLFLKRAFVPVETPSNTKKGETVKSTDTGADAGKPREME